MKTLIHTRIYALLTQNESNPSELAHAYEEFIETMTEMVANFDNRDDILRILYYSRVEFDVLSHPSFNRYSNNVLRTTFIYKIMYILDCEINIVSNSTKYSSNQDYSFPLSYQDGELLWTGTQQELLELAVALHKNGIIMYGNRKARFIEIVRALSSTFHITINDVYVKKTRMLDRSTAVTPFLDKLKKPMSKSSKDTCDRESGDLSRTRKIRKFFSVCKVSTVYFSVDYIFILYKKLFDFSREASGKVYFSVILYYTFAAESDA